MESNHIKTPECGFDRQASHSAGRYVCACGYVEQPTIALAAMEPKPCCQEWHTCNRPCVPLAENWRMDAKRNEQRITELEAQNAALREDAERIDWCELHQRFPSRTRPGTTIGFVGWTCSTADGLMQVEAATARAAIDAARES